jgi:hypothetical protein
MTPEEAYEEALRRIREAEETGAVELDLSGYNDGNYTELETLTRLPPELTRLTWLQSLNLFYCQKLSGDLSPLAGLTSLQSLNLNRCDRLSGDLSPLADLTSLQSLNLHKCWQFSGDLSPLVGLTKLQSLNLYACQQRIRRFLPRSNPCCSSWRSSTSLAANWMICPLKSAAKIEKTTSWIKSSPTMRTLN